MDDRAAGRVKVLALTLASAFVVLISELGIITTAGDHPSRAVKVMIVLLLVLESTLLIQAIAYVIVILHTAKTWREN
jgi:hypothetical protein